ncbi:hypothetical protein JKF63_02107 [Porcisia hertigi]|uniref:Uncharacterized protein n=1 Tax=Porcisia hertigi TaxID=2761500 RepID=A0A836HNY6_9TRYP|nr:hypothetical protein JKF63_02107 [Porcisia hertigi]
MADVQRDLSAHYGSHAVRRGLSKPLGPCVHPVIYKGKLSAQRTGVHHPQYMRVWVMRLVHRSWCLRCGVWLTRGDAHQPAKSTVRPTRLTTLRECCVRRRLHSPRLPAKRRRYMLCCLRCLQTAQRAAKRNVVLSAIATGEQQQSPAVARKSVLNASQPTRHAAQRARAPSVERAVMAVMAKARVPRRNRRCCRRSQCRRRSSNEEALGRAAVKISAHSENLSATHQLSTSVSQLTQKLAASLNRKVTPSIGVGGSGRATRALAGEVLTTARNAQRNLQNLVPSGPLRKNAPHKSSAEPLRPNPKKPPSTCSVASKGPAGATEQSVVTMGAFRTSPSAPSSTISATDGYAQVIEQPVVTRPGERMGVFRKKENTTDTVLTLTASSSAAAEAAGSTPPVINSLPSSAPPGPRVRLASAEVLVSAPRRPNAAKQAARPPAKTATATKSPATAKKKLMDTMNRLGF